MNVIENSALSLAIVLGCCWMNGWWCSCFLWWFKMASSHLLEKPCPLSNFNFINHQRKLMLRWLHMVGKARSFLPNPCWFTCGIFCTFGEKAFDFTLYDAEICLLLSELNDTERPPFVGAYLLDKRTIWFSLY